VVVPGASPVLDAEELLPSVLETSLLQPTLASETVKAARLVRRKTRADKPPVKEDLGRFMIGGARMCGAQ